jgi:hypothetical protein
VRGDEVLAHPVEGVAAGRLLTSVGEGEHGGLLNKADHHRRHLLTP